MTDIRFSPYYMDRGPGAPTAGELNAAGVGYVNHGSDTSSDTRSTTHRPRALTGTSNDNLRAAKRHTNDMTRNEVRTQVAMPLNNMPTGPSHFRGQVPSRDAYVYPAPHPGEWAQHCVRPTYGHPQSRAPEITQSHPDTVTNQSFVDTTPYGSEQAHRSTRPVYGRSQGHASETTRVRSDTPRNQPPVNPTLITHGGAGDFARPTSGRAHGQASSVASASPRPAVPFGTTETHGHPVLPLSKPSDTVLVPRLPPIQPAPATLRPLWFYQTPTRMPITIRRRKRHCTRMVLLLSRCGQLLILLLWLVPPRLIALVWPCPPRNLLEPVAAMYKPPARASGSPKRIPSPKLGSANIFLSPHTPPLTYDNPGWRVLGFDSSPLDATPPAPSRRRQTLMAEDETYDEDEGGYNEDELQTHDEEYDVPSGQWTEGDGQYYNNWHLTHSWAEFPGGPMPG
ncbi:hypothetical protein FS749_000412 [Ceratobasidium sp. UAMH 11750]|nr:hypothetical protein FS749_000412 [Ceratobasidium sp. UAMH 11750]